MSLPAITRTGVDGLLLVDLAVHEDARGSFREAFQQEKLAASGLPAMGPVQWNLSENLRRGVLRGIHAEPWDKYVHVVVGQVFAAIADLRRDSPTFKQVRTFTLDRTRALFVPAGLGNSYQALTDGAVCGYLVNAHWRPDTRYLGVAWNDPELAIPWPLAPGPQDLSDKDRALPTLAEALGNAPA